MTDNQDSVTAGAVQPPTDRPLTAGDIDWSAPLPDALWSHFNLAYGLSREEASEAAGEVLDIIAQQSARPATSAASEGEGVDYATLSDLHTIKGWLHGLATNPDLNDVVADGGVTTGDCYQQEAREFAGRIGRCIAALASPPASERERELGGVIERMTKVARGDVATDTLTTATNRLNAVIDIALTAQPAGEGK